MFESIKLFFRVSKVLHYKKKPLLLNKRADCSRVSAEKIIMYRFRIGVAENKYEIKIYRLDNIWHAKTINKAQEEFHIWHIDQNRFFTLNFEPSVLVKNIHFFKIQCKWTAKITWNSKRRNEEKAQKVNLIRFCFILFHCSYGLICNEIQTRTERRRAWAYGDEERRVVAVGFGFMTF